MYRVAARMLLTLIAPHRPLSVVTRIITARLPSRRTRNGCLYSVAREAAVWSTSSIFSEYGRVALTRACARFKRVAATTCIALVIFWVFRIESIRRTISLNAGTYLTFGSRGFLGFGSSEMAARIWSSCDGRPSASSSFAEACAVGARAALGPSLAGAGAGAASTVPVAGLGPPPPWPPPEGGRGL